MVTSLHSTVGGTKRINQFGRSIFAESASESKVFDKSKKEMAGGSLPTACLGGSQAKERGDKGGRRGRPKNTTLASTGRFDLPRLLRARLGRRLLYRDLAAWLCL